MKLEEQKARMVMFANHFDVRMANINGVSLGVKIDGKMYEIDGILSPFTFGPVGCDDFVNITASFGEYDLETVTC